LTCFSFSIQLTFVSFSGFSNVTLL